MDDGVAVCSATPAVPLMAAKTSAPPSSAGRAKHEEADHRKRRGPPRGAAIVVRPAPLVAGRVVVAPVVVALVVVTTLLRAGRHVSGRPILVPLRCRFGSRCAGCRHHGGLRGEGGLFDGRWTGSDDPWDELGGSRARGFVDADRGISRLVEEVEARSILLRSAWLAACKVICGFGDEDSRRVR